MDTNLSEKPPVFTIYIHFEVPFCLSPFRKSLASSLCSSATHDDISSANTVLNDPTSAENKEETHGRKDQWRKKLVK